MTPEQREAFFTVHRDLPREGPGAPEDVLWALSVTGTTGPARVLDAACGPGADLAVLAEALSQAQIEGLEMVPHFADAAAAQVQQHAPRVTARVGDMAAVTGPYDLIWCAGALYFLGVTEGLQIWRAALALGGHVAFSEPVLLSTPPTPEVAAFWEEYPQITDLAGIEARVTAAGFRMLGHRMIVGAQWQAYYDPMQARIDRLRAQSPDAALTAALDENQLEIDRWRAAADSIAYALLVVAPK